eukprot:TRINITY_DN107227_c0_g1_i1.p1 TRINITY_DN107227_c0_g1~~TRINITY_DN107227_c0_g1_i1.p1  ORF type:complete len:1037 (+),score=180.25 TRINITY_DN107227_c0_g1_i1:57-3167(+)
MAFRPGFLFRLKPHVALLGKPALRRGCASRDAVEGWHDAVKVFRLMYAFRRRGHLAAQLDPLRGEQSRPLDPKEPINWRIGGSHGQKIADIDLNRLLLNYPAELDLEVFGLGKYKENDPLPVGVEIPSHWFSAPPSEGAVRWTFRNFIDHLCDSYSGKVSIEHQHIDDPGERNWLEERMEARAAGAHRASAACQRRALQELVRADTLERFLGGKYPSAKRFGLEGCEALLPGLLAAIDQASQLGLEDLLLGMAHRGRLNLLVNLLGKRVSEVCSEFGEQIDFLGDVKYHLGTRGTFEVGGRKVYLTLAPNPSHLEAVDPVVLGMTRAKQDYKSDHDMRRVMGVLIHGDAAFSGQGIISECMQLSDLPAYATGGTVHFVINNLVGFTTDPRAARSSYHCTNVAKLNDSPIIHVNADDVDSVLFASKLAAEYRQTFRKDVVVDLVCYRREGHSEVDDASLTQPLSRARIRSHPPVLEIYGAKLVDEGIVTQEHIDADVEQVHDEFEAEYRHAQLHSPDMQSWRLKEPGIRPVNVTGLPPQWLARIGEACCRIPEGFNAHPTVKKIFQARKRQLKEGRVDWSLAETLAVATLILNFNPESSELTTALIHDELSGQADHYVEHPPCHVRLSGQDVERGTFNQRHSIIYDQDTAMPHSILKDLGLGKQSEAVVCNSSLSELAILGFEYGYSLEEGLGLALTIWEAQFGDFANCAQAIIDNFIASGESKWGAKSCLVLLLPHGFEGQGPEHSSARPERFLQLVDEDPDNLWPYDESTNNRVQEEHVSRLESTSDEARSVVLAALKAFQHGDEAGFALAMRRMALLQETYDYCRNMAVVYITTPANLFHVLRRQVHRTFAKPLVVMSAKYLLHHRPCRSPLQHMGAGTRFQRVIVERGAGDNMLYKEPEASQNQPELCRRLIFCSGKIFYELHHARAARKLEGVVELARLEQVAPFPAMEVAFCACRHPSAELVWVQEEPKNMGPWSYIAPRFATALRELSPERHEKELRFVGRPAAASPATALFKMHKQEARAILEEALSFK